MILGILGLLGFAPIGLAVLFGLFVGGIGVIGGLLTAAIEILSALGSGVFSVGGVAIGIVIGLVAFRCFRNRQREEAARQENIGTVDGVEVEQMIEPEKVYRTNF